MNDITSSEGNQVNRRSFLKGGSFATLMTLLGGVELKAQTASKPADEIDPAEKLPCAVIGLGAWGREIIGNLNRLPKARIAAVCDNYPAYLRRGLNAAPGAEGVADYRRILDNKEIKAVVIATPSHKHREIAVAALKAGKHVYCEAPLATTIEDAQAIATAAHQAVGSVFQSGLQVRSDPQRRFLLPFVRAGAMGRTISARAQWHKKTSWRLTSPNPDREVELNWRLRRETSGGLLSEIGVHHIDAAAWYLNGLPVSVTGFGGLLQWQDGRDVYDTVQAVFEFPHGVNFFYDCTLANSFDSDYEMYYGTDAAIMMRESKSWMFKEVDSPLLGWEVYARKDSFYKETGIALVANATKLNAQAKTATDDSPSEDTPLFYALESFIQNGKLISGGVDDFTANFDATDKNALAEYLSSLTQLPTAGIKEGFQASVISIKANEAALKGTKITFEKQWFDSV